MYICPNCKKTSDTPMRFCTSCGTPMEEQQPIQTPQPQEPQYQQPEPQAPQYQQPEPQAPQYQQPEPQAPQYQQPEPQAPQYQQPEPQAPQYQQPQPEAPQYQQPQPQYQQPQPQAPQYQQPQPQYQQPQYQQPQYQYPQQNAYAEPSKAKVIVGMILSIAGLGMGSIGILYTLLLVGVEIAGFTFGLVFFIFSFPLSLIGLIMSNGNINAGSRSNMSSIGKKLGIVGVIIAGVMLMLAFINLGIGF